MDETERLEKARPGPRSEKWAERPIREVGRAPDSETAPASCAALQPIYSNSLKCLPSVQTQPDGHIILQANRPASPMELPCYPAPRLLVVVSSASASASASALLIDDARPATIRTLADRVPPPRRAAHSPVQSPAGSQAGWELDAADRRHRSGQSTVDQGRPSHGGRAELMAITPHAQTRYVEGAVESLVRTLKWAGLDYDEGQSRSALRFVRAERRASQGLIHRTKQGPTRSATDEGRTSNRSASIYTTST